MFGRGSDQTSTPQNISVTYEGVRHDGGPYSPDFWYTRYKINFVVAETGNRHTGYVHWGKDAVTAYADNHERNLRDGMKAFTLGGVVCQMIVERVDRKRSRWVWDIGGTRCVLDRGPEYGSQ